MILGAESLDVFCDRLTINERFALAHLIGRWRYRGLAMRPEVDTESPFLVVAEKEAFESYSRRHGVDE